MCLAAGLDAMSPLKVLSRGYTIVSTEDDINVKSVKNISVGDSLSLRFSDGIAKCTVDKIGTEKCEG